MFKLFHRTLAFPVGQEAIRILTAGERWELLLEILPDLAASPDTFLSFNNTVERSIASNRLEIVEVVYAKLTVNTSHPIFTAVFHTTPFNQAIFDFLRQTRLNFNPNRSLILFLGFDNAKLEGVKRLLELGAVPELGPRGKPLGATLNTAVEILFFLVKKLKEIEEKEGRLFSMEENLHFLLEAGIAQGNRLSHLQCQFNSAQPLSSNESCQLSIGSGQCPHSPGLIPL